jgi:hypothetical protein
MDALDSMDRMGNQSDPFDLLGAWNLELLWTLDVGVWSFANALANRRKISHHSPMQSHELLREVFEQHSPKQVSADLGLSTSMIYKWAEPADASTGSGSANPLDRIEALLRSTNDLRLVHWICQRAGGFFIRNPKTTNPHPSYLIPATNQIVQEFADLLAVVAAAAADNYVTAKEAKDIRARWEELKSVTETFVACCEGGNFSHLREKHAAGKLHIRTSNHQGSAAHQIPKIGPAEPPSTVA